MNTDALAIIVPGATAVLLAGISIWYQRWLTDKTLGQQAELTQKTLDHERTIARDQRVHEHVADTYVQMIEMFDWIMEIVNATQPILEPGPVAPPEPASEALRPVQARIAAYASPEVKRMIYEQWIPVRNNFFAAAIYLATMRQAQDQGREVEAAYGISVASQYMKVDALRKQLHGVVRDIEDRANEELRQ